MSGRKKQTATEATASELGIVTGTAKPGFKLQAHWRRAGMGLWVMCLVLLAGAVTYGLYRHVRHEDRSGKAVSIIGKECEQPKTKQLLQQAAGKLSGTDTTGLGVVAAKIQKVAGYNLDPNCLYPVVVYYIRLGDAVNAQLYFTKYQSVYMPKEGLSPLLGKQIITESDLASTVDLLVQNNQAPSNSFSFGQP